MPHNRNGTKNYPPPRKEGGGGGGCVFTVVLCVSLSKLTIIFTVVAFCTRGYQYVCELVVRAVKLHHAKAKQGEQDNCLEETRVWINSRSAAQLIRILVPGPGIRPHHPNLGV